MKTMQVFIASILAYLLAHLMLCVEILVAYLLQFEYDQLMEENLATTSSRSTETSQRVWALVAAVMHGMAAFAVLCLGVFASWAFLMVGGASMAVAEGVADPDWYLPVYGLCAAPLAVSGVYAAVGLGILLRWRWVYYVAACLALLAFLGGLAASAFVLIDSLRQGNADALSSLCFLGIFLMGDIFLVIALWQGYPRKSSF